MSSSADVYMLTYSTSNEEAVIILRAALKSVCEDVWSGDYKGVCDRTLNSLGNTHSMSDIVNLSQGTLSLVNGILFCRSSAYACDYVADPHAEIFNAAIYRSGIFVQHHITEIRY